MEQLLLLGVGMSGSKTYCENANEEQIDPMSLQYNNVEDAQTHLDQTYHMKIKAEPRFEYLNIESCLQEISSTSKFKMLKEKYLPKIQNELEASKVILKNRQIQIDSLRAKVSLIVDFIKTKVGRPQSEIKDLQLAVESLETIFDNLNQAVNPNTSAEVQKVHLFSAYNMYHENIR
jgi:hypothetical protein